MGPRQWAGGAGAKLPSSPLALRRVGASRRRSAQGTPPPAARRAQGRGGRRLWEDGTAARAHLDEELDDGLFVLLLQPVQRHRQRHGRFGWAPRTAAAAVSAPGLLWLRAPAARQLPGLSWRLARLSLRASGSSPQHRPTPRARLRGGRSPGPFKSRGRGAGAGSRLGAGPKAGVSGLSRGKVGGRSSGAWPRPSGC